MAISPREQALQVRDLLVQMQAGLRDNGPEVAVAWADEMIVTCQWLIGSLDPGSGATSVDLEERRTGPAISRPDPSDDRPPAGSP
jgi:hypothetical protein